MFATKDTFNKLDLVTSGKKEDSRNLLTLVVKLSFSLKVNVAINYIRESRVFHSATGNSSSQVGRRGHRNRLTQR